MCLNLVAIGVSPLFIPLFARRHDCNSCLFTSEELLDHRRGTLLKSLTDVGFEIGER